MTRDHGSERLLEATVEDPPAAETVARFLDREAEIETSYGGNFVDSIAGLSGSSGDGGRSDWFFYVNGYWSPVGAAEARVRAGDRIWWDLRRWQEAYRVPAVVGSFPAPFAHGFGGEQLPVAVDCRSGPATCVAVEDALRRAGAQRAAAGDEERLRVLVGPLAKIGDDPDAKLLAGGPGESGVYARPAASGRAIAALDDRGEPAVRLGASSGLVAAVRRGERPVSWLVTGTDESGVRAAAAALEPESLADAYALAIDRGGTPIPLPVTEALSGPVAE